MNRVRVGCFILFILSFIVFATPIQASYSRDHIIVLFREGQTPEELQHQSTVREQRKSLGVSGFLQNQMENIELKIHNRREPEYAVQEMHLLEQEHLVINYEKFTSLQNSIGSLSRLRIIETNTNASIEDVAKAYQALPEVEYVVYDYEFTLQATPNDSLYSQQWGLKKMNAEQAWNITTGSNGLTVVTIDSGADYNHPDLKAHLFDGVNTINNTHNAQDDAGHGTHVAGIIGAVTNNVAGVAGINWNINILPIKATNHAGVGSITSTVNAILTATNIADAYRIKVINMSLSSPRFQVDANGNSVDICNLGFNEAINAAKQKNITLVVAAGNNGKEAKNYAPGGCEGVITVSATGPNDEQSFYTNYGTAVVLSAPGGNSESPGNCDSQHCILSTWLGGGYKLLEGTSMATPQVSGAVALMYAVNPNLTPDKVRALLSDPGNLDPVLSSKQIGAGRPNLLKLVNAARLQPTNITRKKSQGDANCDNIINLADFEIWRKEYTHALSSKTADFNGNGSVGVDDFEVWRKGYFSPV